MSIKNSKKDFLKLLARTSVVGLAVMSVGSANAAAPRTTSAANSLTSDAASWSGAGAIADNDSIVLGDDAHNITFDATKTLKGLDLDIRNPTGTITVQEAADGSSLGAIGNGGGTIDLTIEDGAGPHTFTLDGTASLDAGPNVATKDYTGLGATQIGANATLVLDSLANTTFTNTFDSIDAADEGTLTTGANAVTLNGAIGSKFRLLELETGAGAATFGSTLEAATVTTNAGKVTFKGNVTATNVNLADDASEIEIGDNVTVTAAVDNTDAGANNSKITFTNAGGTTSKIVGAIGATNEISEIITNAGDVEFSGGHVEVGTITTNAGAVSFASNVTGDIDMEDAAARVTLSDGVTVTGAIDCPNNADEGALHFAAGGTVTGAIGGTNRLSSINLNGAGTVDLQDTVVANTIAFNNDNAILQIADDVVSQTPITGSSADGGGSIHVNADGKSVTGSIGTAAAKISAIKILGDHDLKIVGGDHFVNLITNKNVNEGKLEFSAAAKLTGDIGAADRMLNHVEVSGGHALTLVGSSYTLNGIKLNNNGAKLIVDGNGSVVNSVIGEGAARGLVEVAEDANVTFSSIGAGTAIERLTLTAGNVGITKATIDGNATFDGTVSTGGTTEGIEFNANTELTVNAGKILTFDNNATIDATGDDRGTLILNGQTIGTIAAPVTIGANNRLNTVRAASGEVKLHGHSRANSFEIGQGATLFTDTANVTAQTSIMPYENGADASTGKLKINAGNVTVGTNATAGALGKIAEVDFQSNHTLKVESSAAAVFDAAAVTTSTDNEGIVHVVSRGDYNVPTNFSTMDGNKLNKITFEFANNADAVVNLKGGVINAAEINLTSPDHANNYALSLGHNSGNKALNPQIIIGDIKGAKNGLGSGKNNVNISGHTFVEGDIGNDIDKVVFTGASQRLYLTKNISGGVDFDQDGLLYLFEGDHTVNNAIAIVNNDTTRGCVVARGLSAAEAKPHFLDPNSTYNLDANVYSDTLKIGGKIGDLANNKKLKMVDVGNGTLEFNSAAPTEVNVQMANAKVVKFNSADTVYNIDTLMDSNDGGNVEELVFMANSKLAKNSTLLGTESNALKTRISVDGGPHTLTLQDNVNINVEEHGVNQFSGGGNNLVFEGDSNVWSKLGPQGSEFGQIKIAPTAANKTVTFYKDVNSTGTILLDNNGHLAQAVIHGNVTGGINIKNHAEGVVTLVGSNQTIDSIGVLGAKNLGLLNVDTDKATVSNNFAVDTVTFKKDGTLTIKNNPELDERATTTAGDGTGTIIIEDSGDWSPLGGFGDATTRLKALVMGEGTNKITIANGKNDNNTLIKGRVDSVGVVEFDGGSDSQLLDIGESGNRLASIEFAGAGNVVKVRDLHASNINVGNNTLQVRSARGITDISGGGTANVIDGGYINVKGAGDLNVNGSAQIAGAGTAAAPLVNFNATEPGVVTSLTTSEVHSADFAHKNSTVNTSGAVKINGNYSTENATLGTKGKFEVTGNVVLDKSFAINDMSSGVALDLSDSAGVNIATLSSATITLNAQEGASFANGRSLIGFNVAYKNEAGNAFKTFLDKTTITSTHPLFSKVKIAEPLEGSKFATLETEFTAQKAVDNLAGLTGGEKTALVDIFTANQENSALLDDIALTPDSLGGFKEAATRFATSETPKVVATQAVESVMAEVADIAALRINNAALGTVPQAASAADAEKMVGVAAGDKSEKFGLWASALGGVARQDKRRNSTAFRSSMFGGLVGADTMLSDKAMAGFAIGNAQGNVKFKDFRLGDKIKSSTWVFSGYGSYAFADNWFVRGAVTGSSTKVNSSEKRIGRNTGVAFAKGKYSVESFSAEAAVGYNFRTAGGGTFTPSVGVRLGRVNDIEYKESGAGVQSREVKHKAANTTSVLLGAQYSTTQYWDDVVLTPEAHLNVRYGHGVKTPKGKFKPLGTNTFASYTGDKPSNLNVNMGAGVTSNLDNIEYGVGYDVYLADKYIGHQGTLKVKVKL